MSQTLAAGEAAMLEGIVRIRESLFAAGDRGNAVKLEQLIDKKHAETCYLAFCGHFSAGKSTLINQLCGHPLLPSSPIPTSANIVSIQNGEPGGIVTHRNRTEGGSRRQEVSLDSLEAYCVNGADIETVNISYPIPILGDHAILLDTPGIDSTDEAHHMATESALHLADVVFYVMDYNHVQSEVNFAFTKKMKEWGKPLYLIVNMIDKHKEHELSFERYRQGTLEAFRTWGIEPDGVLYATMKEPGHPYNEWGKLKGLLHALIAQSEAISEYSIDLAAHHVVEEHGKWAAQQSEPKKAELREAIDREGDLAGLQERLAAKERELEAAQSLPETLTAELRKEVSGIIENANITPALTRDKADAYLQSRKPGFKVGFLARASQTAAEIARRLEAFQADFAEQAHAQLDWHLRDALKKAAGVHGLKTEPIEAEIEALHVEVASGWLAEQVNPGAGFSGEYTLNYMRQVAADVKGQYRKQAFAVIDTLAAAVRERGSQAAPALAEEIAALRSRLSAVHELQRLEHAEAAAQEALLQLARWRKPLPPALPDLQRIASMEEAAAAPQGGGLHVPSMGTVLAAAGTAAAPAPSAAPQGADAAASVFTRSEHGRRMERKAAALQAAADLIEGIPSMRSLSRSMREKAERLRGRTFTIALFGAFSAGKSSFANALIGERVLPVSPNPTTAAINRILPPQDGWPHGTAKVKMKSRDAILQDIQYSFEVLGVPVADVESAVTRIGALVPSAVTAKGKPHFSFLKAVEKGWKEAEANLGAELRITKDEFPGYVADEAKSCFVDYIELYYSNPLTDQGIVFVDTPGADSINARHTGVAFNYIKNADAILFVTYYNHAFSQADREFLLQLGRVKDSFELDKMFFIVNAADLASSPEELDGVVRHVETNLLQHGIRHPRIYPLSSYLAAEGKIGRDSGLLEQSGIVPFEEDFVSFSLEELSEIAIHAADQELHRAMHVLQRWIESAQEGEAQREASLQLLRGSQVKALQYLDEQAMKPGLRELTKEIQELIYYVKQRSMYRFGELYNLAFNPSSFREDTRDSKQSLTMAWQELLRMIAFDLSQEILATTLRVENFMNRSASERYREWESNLAAIVPGYECGEYEACKFATPGVTAKLEAPDVSEKLLTSLFKNAKHFFEGEGKVKLRGELEARLQAPVASLMERHVLELEAEYVKQLEAWLAQLLEKQRQALTEHVEGLLAALEMKVNLEELASIRDGLQLLI